jgi:Gpi18-like mannosyltransferase
MHNSSPRLGVSPQVIAFVMAYAGLAAAIGLLRIPDPPHGDFTLFLFPWLDVIRERGWASISGEFSAYTPPYIYLLNLVPMLEPSVGTMAAVKLLNLPFYFGTAIGVGAIVASATGDRDRGWIAAAATFVVPTLLINAFAWGQADSIFTCFAVWFVLFTMRGKPAVAALMFGLALAFKAQAMFLSPLLLYLVLSRQMRLREAMIVPLVYVAMMVPAALAGRPWAELLTVYYVQTQIPTMQELSFNAPNPWWYLQLVMPYRTGLIIGLAAGALTGAILAFGSTRHKPGPSSILIIACISAAAMPYVLPNMTARYFFVADILTVGLAFVRLRLWPAAALIQLGSLLAYLTYFTGVGMAFAAVFPTSCGILLLAFSWIDNLRRLTSMDPSNVIQPK